MFLKRACCKTKQLTIARCQDRTRALGDALQKCKQAQQRAEQSLAMFAKIQAELKELQRPVGNKVEDVQAMLDSYQVSDSHHF